MWVIDIRHWLGESLSRDAHFIKDHGEKMKKGMELIKFDDPKNLVEFLQQPAIKIAEFITGILVSETKDWKLSAGHLVQASIKWKLYSQLGKELKAYIEKGKIKENFLNEEQCKQSLSDLLKFIDETTPGEDRFNAMKTLFFKSVSCDSSQEEQILSYQFMKVCKELDSEHLLILKAAYDIKCGKINTKLLSTKLDLNDRSAERWLQNISNQIGHGIKSLIEIQEDKLINMKLISPRTSSDLSGVRSIENYRLTDLGCKLCDFIYEINL